MGENPKKKGGSLRVTSGGHNVGALHKHLEARLNAQEQGKSPDLISPGTPNKWGAPPHQVATLQKETDAKGRSSDSDHLPLESAVKDLGSLLNYLFS